MSESETSLTFESLTVIAVAVLPSAAACGLGVAARASLYPQQSCPRSQPGSTSFYNGAGGQFAVTEFTYSGGPTHVLSVGEAGESLEGFVVRHEAVVVSHKRNLGVE